MKALTKVQKFVKENNIEVVNVTEILNEKHNGGTIATQPKTELRIHFTDAVYSDGKRAYTITWFNPTVEGFEVEFLECKTQKAMIEKCMELLGMDTEPVTEKIVEKSAVAPLETPVKITPESTAMNVSIESESARQIEKLIKLSGDGSHDVLDYGCGLGRNIKYLLQNTNCFVDGCDTADQVVNINKDAEKMAFFKNQATTVTTADKLSDESYDYILNSHVLNVVQDDIKKIIVDDIYRLLRVNGKAVIQVRTASDVEKAVSKVPHGDGWLIKKGKNTTYQEGITEEKMARLLTDAGFKIINHRVTKTIHMVEVTK